MAIREALNKNKPMAIAVCVVLLAGVLGLRYWSSASDVPAASTRAYYSDDDGKTYFEDNSAKICPFDHNGKQAVRAVVFRYGDATPFVAYLSRFTEKDQKRLQDLRAMPMTPDVAKSIQSISTDSMQVKKPGDGKWVTINTAAGRDVMNPSSLAGEAGDLTSVDP